MSAYITPPDLRAGGYRIEIGSADMPPNLRGRYYWTWAADLFIDVTCSHGDWDSLTEAVKDARRDMHEHTDGDALLH